MAVRLAVTNFITKEIKMLLIRYKIMIHQLNKTYPSLK